MWLVLCNMKHAPPPLLSQHCSELALHCHFRAQDSPHNSTGQGVAHFSWLRRVGTAACRSRHVQAAVRFTSHLQVGCGRHGSMSSQCAQLSLGSMQVQRRSSRQAAAAAAAAAGRWPADPATPASQCAGAAEHSAHTVQQQPRAWAWLSIRSWGEAPVQPAPCTPSGGGASPAAGWLRSSSARRGSRYIHAWVAGFHCCSPGCSTAGWHSAACPARPLHPAAAAPATRRLAPGWPGPLPLLRGAGRHIRA